MKIKTGDKVIVLSGKDKGKTGKVISADPKNGKVIVEGVSVATKHQKAKKQGQDGGIMKVETPMYVSKVQLVCPKCGKGTRVYLDSCLSMFSLCRVDFIICLGLFI